MERFLIAAVLGLFSQPSAPVSVTPVAAVAAPAAPAVTAVMDLARVEAQAPEDAARLAKPPVAAPAAAHARRAVRHEKTPGENGRITHRFTFPDGAVVEFTDRPHNGREQAKRERVLSYVGTEAASKEPDSTFDAAGRTFGLSAEAVLALRFISQHEGGFDAINTWDSARFSWGFIQFAGGYGLRPALAHFKQRSPELFRKLLAEYGVDVLPGEDGRPEPVCVNPASGRLLRGKDAEQEYGDEPLLIALFIRAGRAPEVKQRQLEAAIRDYAIPALQATHHGVRLSDVLRSPQALAMLIDRQVQEGTTVRLEWALEQAAIVNRSPSPADWARLEGQVLDLAVQDAEARAYIAERAELAAAALERAASAARDGQLQYVPDGPTLSSAREAMHQAFIEAQYRMVASWRRDALSQGFNAAFLGSDPEGLRGLAASDCAARLQSMAGNVRELVSRLRFEYAIRNRLRGIRSSELAGPAR